jgi:hypothetical protein
MFQPTDGNFATLCISGPDLDLDDVTQLMGCEPSDVTHKGDLTGSDSVSDESRWFLASALPQEEPVEKHILDVLQKPTADLRTWRHLGSKHSVHINCMLQLEDIFRGFTLSSRTLRLLAERRVELSFDVLGYLERTEEGAEPPAGVRLVRRLLKMPPDWLKGLLEDPDEGGR